MPRTHPRVAATTALLASGLALGLVGCGGGTAATPTASPPATPSPIFASDEEALAAAEEAYAAYAAASAAIGSDGGAGVERLRDLVDSDLYEQSVNEFRQFEELGLRSEGASVVSNAMVADHHTQGDGVVISVYLCRDVSAVRILDQAGYDVTPSGRQDRQSLLVSLQGNREQLVISQILPWKDRALCE